MTDAAVVGRLLRAYHQRAIEPAAVRRLSGSVHGPAVSYLFTPLDGPALVVRACRADAPVAVQFRGPFSATALDCLLGRAATLEFLAGHEYPAPRLILTHAGDPVGLDGVWLTMATSYVAGPVLRPELGELRLLGESLGRLHAVPVHEAGPGDAGPVPGPGGAGPVPGPAAWHPAAAIPAALDRLDRVASLVPGDWRDMFGTFRDTVLAVQQHLAELPRGVVHGEAWPGNAVLAGPDRVVLIDWENAGTGLPVLDLGYCLIESLLDVPWRAAGAPGAQPPDAVPPGTVLPGTVPPGTGGVPWLVQPDEARIAAVAAGYSAVRLLPSAERDLLLPAIRFATAYAGAIYLEQALLEGAAGESMTARLARLRNRLEVSADVARLASPYLAAGPEPVR